MNLINALCATLATIFTKIPVESAQIIAKIVFMRILKYCALNASMIIILIMENAKIVTLNAVTVLLNVKNV